MKLTLKNIGKIIAADIDIKGITVIAGENNTGKSTVSRALFSVFNGFYNLPARIQDARIKNITNLTTFLDESIKLLHVHDFDISVLVKKIVENSQVYKKDKEKLKEAIIQFFYDFDKSADKNLDSVDFSIYLSRLQNTLQVSNSEMEKALIEKQLSDEFFGQVNNLYVKDKGEIQLQIQERNMCLSIQDDKVSEIHNDSHMELRTEAIYIDDPFVVDDAILVYYPNDKEDRHRMHLIKKLWNTAPTQPDIIDKIITDKSLDMIYGKINQVCGGDIIKQQAYQYGYRLKESEKTLSIQNISTGMKTFVILKVLLQKGEIKPYGTVILDEPEIHLHPEWQVLFAELIVLLQQSFHLHILLNTHSPYFLNAIEVYSEKYGVADLCKYYLANRDGDNGVITDVTGNTEAIYEKLARPFQKLENERYSDD